MDLPGRAGGGAPLTVLFTDVEGSTDLRRRVGDDLAQQILAAHDELVRAAVREHDGREIKALGDGFMVAFISPRRALACAQAIQRAVANCSPGQPDREVRVRIGVNTGEVIEQDGDLFGQAVHAAARIAAKASGGEILVSDVTRRLIGTSPEFAFSDRGRFRLKGFDGRWRLFGLGWSTPDEVGAAQPPALGGLRDRTPFVGRTPERARLGAALDQARRGSGGVILIGGEPGIGKTRLAEELAVEAVRSGMAALAGHSYERMGASPYVAFVEILEAALADADGPESFRTDVLGEAAPEIARLVPRLRRLFVDLAAPLDLPPAEERQYLFSCLADVFRRLAGLRPTLVVLDDIQWADEPTLLFVEHLASELPELRLLVVATYRDVEAGRPLSRTIAELHRRRLAERISLGGMSEREAADLINVLAGYDAPGPLVKALHGGTEGNPFFLEEVFRDLVERGRLFDAHGRFRENINVGALDVPEGVRLVIGRRLERLSDDAQRLLSAAAVAGRVFSFRLLQGLGDWDADTVLDVIDEAEEAMLVREGPGDDEFLFSHELVRQTLSATLSGPRRRRAHLRAAEAMAQLWAEARDEHASEIAHHLIEAGDEADRNELVVYCLLAGQRALDTSAFEEAVAHLERAGTMAGVASPRQRAELFFALGSAHGRLGHWDDALSASQQSLEEYEALDDDEAVGRTCLEVGFNLAWANRIPEALDMFGRGLRALGESVTADRSRLLARMATFVAFAGDLAGSDAMFAEARRVADDLGDPGLVGFVLGEMACASHASMRFTDGLAAGRQGAELMERAGDLWGAATAWGFVEVFSVHTGRFADTLAVAAEMVPLAERIGNQPALYLDGRARGMLAFFRDGDLDALEAFARWDAAFAERAGGAWIGHSYTWLGLVEFLRGNWDVAGDWFQRGSEQAPALAPGFCWGAWFQYLAFSERSTEALSFVDGKRDLLPKNGQPNMWDAWTLLFAFTEGLFVLGHRQEPSGWYPLIAEAAATGAVTTDNIFGRLLERIAAIAATAAGDWDTAERHFLLALRQADELPHQLERLETRRFYAQMLAERSRPGDCTRAEKLLHEAIDGFSRLGMARHAHLAESALAGLSV